MRFFGAVNFGQGMAAQPGGASELAWRICRMLRNPVLRRPMATWSGYPGEFVEDFDPGVRRARVAWVIIPIRLRLG
jgi:hypothetical protein